MLIVFEAHMLIVLKCVRVLYYAVVKCASSKKIRLRWRSATLYVYIVAMYSSHVLDRSSSIPITVTWFYIAFINIHQSLILNDETTKQECDLVPRPLSPGWVTSFGYN